MRLLDEFLYKLRVKLGFCPGDFVLRGFVRVILPVKLLSGRFLSWGFYPEDIIGGGVFVI